MQKKAVDKGANKGRKIGPPWNWYRILLVVVPALIPVIYFFLSGKESLVFKDLAIVGLIFTLYWLILFVIATRVLRHKKAMALSMASPLIELPLTAELRSRLSDFAAARQQKPAVVAFEILDREIPRFEQEEERDRALRENEQLRQGGNQGAFLVAVTTEILKRLLLLSGAQEEDRKLWRSHISETAARIVSNALDHRIPVTD
jgi:signal transduction histidine kinase